MFNVKMGKIINSVKKVPILIYYYLLEKLEIESLKLFN